jgi:putative transposase
MPWAAQNLMNRRTEFAMKALQTDNFRALCREYGISPRIGYKWRDRFRQEGLGGMSELSRRPRRSPESVGEEVVCRMVALKERHRHWGPRKIRAVYLRQWGEGPSESSFKRVLERCGMTEKRKVRSSQEAGRIATGRKATAPNEVWTVDFKGWWHDANGRCDPLTVRDEYSRFLLELRALPDATTESVQASFEGVFEQYGLPGAIRSDNGTPFACSQALLGLSRLSAWWLALGIDLERSRPGCPQDNGGHERMHRDIAGELQGTEYGERQAAFDTWRQEFNEQRPHEGLGMKTPAEVYVPSLKRWSGTPEQIRYAKMSTRKVTSSGEIKYEGEKIFLSRSLSGWDLGLQQREDGKLNVYFAQLLLGMLEPETRAFIPTRPSTSTPAAEAALGT